MLRNEIAIMRALQGLLPRMLYCAAERGGLDEAIKAAVEIEEAARREAEAKPRGKACHLCVDKPDCTNECVLGRTALPSVGPSPEGSASKPQGEREGPGSAAAPNAWRRECPRSNVMCESAACRVDGCQAVLAESAQVPEDKPTPAADDTPKQCDGKEQEAFEAWARSQRMDMTEHPLHYLFLDKRTDGARDGWSAALRYCRPFFEAQAREIATGAVLLKRAYDERDAEKARADRLAAALQKIANHPHCVYTKPGDIYEIGVVDGHRCAATVAKEALSTEGGDRG